MAATEATTAGTGIREHTPSAPSAPSLHPDAAPGEEAGRSTEERGGTEAFVGRLFESALGALDLLAIGLGDRLGLYRALRDHGPATAAELAARAGINERYAREWLEQQAVAGILELVADGPAGEHRGDDAGRRYRLPAGPAEALLNEVSLAYVLPLAHAVAGIGGLMPKLVEAYRQGTGLTLEDFGPDAAEFQAAFNRPAYANLLGSQWLPAIPQVHARLREDPPARVADVGCGAGWSSIELAKAYPNARVDGFDADARSIELARRFAAEHGVADRVSFSVRDVSDPAFADELAGRYDVVAAFEMVHDVPRPVEVLRAMRRLAAPGGAVLVMDERTSDTLAAPGSPVDRLMHGVSLFVCLPWGMAEQPSAATGTVMRPSTLRRYAAEAGFAGVRVLPIEHDFFRFYSLVGD